MDIKYDLGVQVSEEDLNQFLLDQYGIDEEAADELTEEELTNYTMELYFIFQLFLHNGLSKIELAPSERLVCHHYDLEAEEPEELQKTIVFRPGNLDQILRVLESPIPGDHVSYRLYVDSNDDIVADVKHSICDFADATYKFRIAPESECFADLDDPGSLPDHSFYYNGLPAGKRIYEFVEPPEDGELGMEICVFGQDIVEDLGL